MLDKHSVEPTANVQAIVVGCYYNRFRKIEECGQQFRSRTEIVAHIPNLQTAILLCFQRPRNFFFWKIALVKVQYDFVWLEILTQQRFYREESGVHSPWMRRETHNERDSLSISLGTFFLA